VESPAEILAAYADYQLKTEREIPVVVLDPSTDIGLRGTIRADGGARGF